MVSQPVRRLLPRPQLFKQPGALPLKSVATAPQDSLRLAMARKVVYSAIGTPEVCLTVFSSVDQSCLLFCAVL